jgi:hypothetical protein
MRLNLLQNEIFVQIKSPYGIKLSLADRSQFEKIVSIPLYAAFEIVERGRERVLSLLEK